MKDNMILDENKVKEWNEELKKVLNVSNEKDVANQLNMSASQYSQMKTNGKFPMEKFVTMMINKGLSLDSFFKIKSINKELLQNLPVIPYLKDENKYILLDDMDNSKDNLRAVRHNNKFIIIDTLINEFKEDGTYAFMQNDFVLVRNIKCCINTEEVTTIELELSSIDDEDKKIIDEEKLKKLNIIGKVVHVIEKEDI